eukprot:gnl/TRDRNA2_/TRDRNA2_177868_c20_seq12.p1 gnl/TRDRNA2_/TRDRNA2_177868_c20~~gnl/TRDRNA2_/TRDRNA2_177868_c20_seq12.p1  ORF type:complete len:621 (+),score=252.12 gnl/TRDRNA2_/TRDRNA2_177868_c20_seq12:3-1865(+)
MLEKGKKEKHEEQVTYNSYKQFCDDTKTEKTRDIAEANEKIDSLTADIEKYTATAATLAKEIAVHEEDISVWNGDIKAATKVREMEKQEYDKTLKDYSESIDALGRAIKTLKGQSHDRAQAAFMQLSNLKELDIMPDDAKDRIESYLSTDEDSLQSAIDEQPAANAYEFQSSGIVEMLEKLEDKFIDEKTTLMKDEMSSKQAFEVLIMDMNAQIGQATKQRDEKAEAKASNLQAKAQAESDVDDTTATRDDDTKYLEDVTATCAEKAEAFASRQKLRAEEIEAIEKAIEIVSSGAVSGAADKHLPAMIQGSSFAQLRSDTRAPAQQRVVTYLQEQAEALHSRVLSAVAARASEDPFAKVKKMIKDLITKLMEEANEEAEQKAWCDTELSTNEQTRKEKTAAVETLHAEIDELEASIAKLTEDITELTDAVAMLDAAMAKATSLREAEKAKNADTTKDAKAAQEAVAQALTVLKEFYEKAGDHGDAGTDMEGQSTGVIGMLEVIQSDFARLEATTKAAEEGAQKEYDDFMLDSKMDHTKKSTDLEHKSAKKQDQTQTLTLKKEDLEGTQKELTAAIAYYDKLKPDCVDSGVSYEEKVAARKEEIESLQEALKILNGEDFSV